MTRLIIIISFVLATVGCASHRVEKKGKKVEIGNRSNMVKNIKNNAKLALEYCGKGNIKKVTFDGYSCKKIKLVGWC